MLAWFRDHYPKSVALEIKASVHDSIPESVLKPHQKASLLSARGAGMAHKIADSGRRLPFDGFVLKNTPAFVVACFTKRGVCYAILVEDWVGAKYHDPMASHQSHTIHL